jgi:hypothetical protein
MALTFSGDTYLTWRDARNSVSPDVREMRVAAKTDAD